MIRRTRKTEKLDSAPFIILVFIVKLTHAFALNNFRVKRTKYLIRDRADVELVNGGVCVSIQI